MGSYVSHPLSSCSSDPLRVKSSTYPLGGSLLLTYHTPPPLLHPSIAPPCGWLLDGIILHFGMLIKTWASTPPLPTYMHRGPKLVCWVFYLKINLLALSEWTLNTFGHGMGLWSSHPIGSCAFRSSWGRATSSCLQISKKANMATFIEVMKPPTCGWSDNFSSKYGHV